MFKWIGSLLAFSAICSVPLQAHPGCCPHTHMVEHVVVSDCYCCAPPQPVVVVPVQPVVVAPCYPVYPCYPATRVSFGGHRVSGHSGFSWSVSVGGPLF